MIQQVSYKHFALNTGFGHATSQINAFDRSLISAGVSDYNLVKISSILPPNCIEATEIYLPKGSLLPTAYTCIQSSKLGVRLAAAVAIGIPEDSNDIGVIIKHCDYTTKGVAEENAQSFALLAMNDRSIKVKKILSRSVECIVETNEYYCAFASVSLW